MSIILMNVNETLLMNLYDEARENARADRCFKQVKDLAPLMMEDKKTVVRVCADLRTGPLTSAFRNSVTMACDHLHKISTLSSPCA